MRLCERESILQVMYGHHWCARCDMDLGGTEPLYPGALESTCCIDWEACCIETAVRLFLR